MEKYTLDQHCGE